MFMYICNKLVIYSPKYGSLHNGDKSEVVVMWTNNDIDRENIDEIWRQFYT